MLYLEDKMNLDKYTEISQTVLRNSLAIAKSYSHQHVTCFHVFKAICNEKNSSILTLLENSGLNFKDDAAVLRASDKNGDGLADDDVNMIGIVRATDNRFIDVTAFQDVNVKSTKFNPNKKQNYNNN